MSLQGGQIDVDERPGVRGVDLRYLLSLVLLDARRSLTVTELAARVETAGIQLGGRASKTISDALRWEIRRGRVQRLGRGRYGTGTVPRATEWRLRRRVAGLLESQLSLQGGHI